MYSYLLSRALDDWDDSVVGEKLIRHARESRRLMESATKVADDPLISLATEIAYDRALVKLSEEHGIETGPEQFLNPRAVRAELEDALRQRGVHVTDRRSSR